MRASRTKSAPFYEYVNVNPKNRISGDCVVRAVALACGQTWEQTVREMTEMGIPKGLVLNDDKLFPLYLESKGFVAHAEPRTPSNRKMALKDFLAQNPQHDRFVCLVGSHHCTCAIGGKVRDIWDCSSNTMHRWWSR